ncbi:MAG: hypothetical protein GWN55_04590, partial [Phycisphaerae bacterium]|nr:hypothetical protein [candidate division KSB1 bacterium]NIV00595.1 hypothetical protein [Phycisphaerae bacterium]NIT70592.1 hypothetical protein [candidate division KSB1 bacterium]NIU24320.1 hypothetical protein [candidate division KSB1 bacterium]NIV70009.1 hypothetical protein [Phycisphaerae bacterium]
LFGLLLTCDSEKGVTPPESPEPPEAPTKITWQQTALDSLEIFALTASPGGEVFAAGPCLSDIYRTIDAGSTWVSTRPRSCVRTLSANTLGNIFGASIGGFASGFLLRSLDGGDSWTILLVGNFPVDPGPIVFSASGEILVGSGRSDETIGGIFRSNDNGDTWEQTSFPDSLSVPQLAINQNGDIFAGTITYGLFRSLDNGESWSEINIGIKNVGRNATVTALAVHPINGYVFAAIAFQGLYRSTDNGNTWQLTSLPNTDIQSLVINASGEIFAGSGGFRSANPEGVFFSEDDGKTWQKINKGLINENIL